MPPVPYKDFKNVGKGSLRLTHLFAQAWTDRHAGINGGRALTQLMQLTAILSFQSAALLWLQIGLASPSGLLDCIAIVSMPVRWLGPGLLVRRFV